MARFIENGKVAKAPNQNSKKRNSDFPRLLSKYGKGRVRKKRGTWSIRSKRFYSFEMDDDAARLRSSAHDSVLPKGFQIKFQNWVKSVSELESFRTHCVVAEPWSLKCCDGDWAGQELSNLWT